MSTRGCKVSMTRFKGIDDEVKGVVDMVQAVDDKVQGIDDEVRARYPWQIGRY